MTQPTDPLEWLDKYTDWDIPEDEDDDGGSLVPALPPDTLDSGGVEEIANILDCVEGLAEKGEIEDLIVIVNTNDDEQFIFHTFERNDLVLGCLSTAQLNYWNTQRLLGIDEGGEDDDCEDSGMVEG